MQLLCFALSLAVIQYIDHAGKAHDHGKQNSTAKPAARKADIRIEHNQCGRSIRMMGAPVLNLSIKIPSFEQHSTQRLLCFQYSRNHRENLLCHSGNLPAAYNLPRLVLLLRCPEYSGGVEVIPQMDEYYSVIQFLPEPLRTELKAMPPERAACVQEIRLRAGQAVQFTVGGAWQPAQQLLPAAQTALAIGPRMLRSCFAALCRDSAYAYENELKQGYFTLPGGSRVGVAGVCGPAGFADITSLNLRVARQVPCVLPPQLRRKLDVLNGGILVVGTPGSGKTTFLRSIIRYLDTARRIFCVADERGELLTAGHTVHCDVYTRCTKAQAIQMALRCMNPQVIVCDELGTQADLQAVEAGLACGVVFVASVHCDTLEALNRKPPTGRLLAMGAFETLVLLDGRVNPGHAVKVRTLA